MLGIHLAQHNSDLRCHLGRDLYPVDHHCDAFEWEKCWSLILWSLVNSLTAKSVLAGEKPVAMYSIST